MVCIGSDWIGFDAGFGLGWIVLGWNGLDWLGLDRVWVGFGLDSFGLGWIRLGWIGLGWIGLDWVDRLVECLERDVSSGLVPEQLFGIKVVDYRRPQFATFWSYDRC